MKFPAGKDRDSPRIGIAGHPHPALFAKRQPDLFLFINFKK